LTGFFDTQAGITVINLLIDTVFGYIAFILRPGNPRWNFGKNRESEIAASNSFDPVNRGEPFR
jgi:hypothetical protein